jgi:hypothetical protein
MSNSGLRAAPLAMAFATLSSVSSAQQAGTNVPTPPPSVPVASPMAGTPVALAVTSGSAGPIADPNEPTIDATTTKHSFLNRPLFFTGLVLLAGGYAPAAVVGGTSDRSDDKKLVYPVVGPWLDYANRDCGVVPCRNENTNKALLIGSGIVQGLGALGVLTSLFIPEKTTRHWYLVGSDGPHVGPAVVGNDGYGVGAFGRF